MGQGLDATERSRLIAAGGARMLGHSGRQVNLSRGRRTTIAEIESILAGAAVTTYYAGGCVRDALLGVAPNDIDISVNRHISEVRTLLAEHFGPENVQIYNARFGVCRFGADSETYLDLSMLMDPAAVEGSTYYRDVTFWLADGLEPDCRMRDFTCNALFWTATAGFIDPLGRGIDDALARRLHICHDPRKSKVDPRLSFRILRFVGLGFQPDDDALAFVRSRIDHDTAWLGADLGSWLHELTRGDEAAIEALIVRAADLAGDQATEARLRAAQATAGLAFSSYLEPTD